MTDRKTLTIPKSVYDDLDDVNLEDESFGDTIARLVEAVDGAGEGEHSPNTPSLEEIREVIREETAELPRETASEVEGRLAHR